MRRLLIAALLLAAAAGAAAADKGLTVKTVRHFSYAGFTRIVLDLEAAGPYVLTKTADGTGLVLTAYDGPLRIAVKLPAVNDGAVQALSVREEGSGQALTIMFGASAGEHKDFVLRSPDRIVIDIMRSAVASAPTATVPARKQVVLMLDPGHGGADGGLATGKGPEKTLALQLALQVRQELRKTAPWLSVRMTREKDRSLTPDERAAAANGAHAAVFISLHVSSDAAARVFMLDAGEGPAQPQAAAGPADFLGFEAESEERQMLWGSQQAAHLDESAVLGKKLVQALGGSAAAPHQAPLTVLPAVDGPAVLVEVGAGTATASSAEAIAKAVERYVRDKR